MNHSRFIAVVVLGLMGLHRASAAEAPAAIVAARTGYIIGAAKDGKWLEGAKAAAVIKPGASFRVYDLTRELGTATASKPESVEEPCPDTYMVKLSPARERGTIALNASWNAMPRKPRIADVTQPVYVEAVREFLAQHDLKQAAVKITQILRIDLDGDGEEEVLMSATNYLTKDGHVPSSAPGGSYSFVLLRRVVAGKVKTQLVAGEFYPRNKEFNAPNRYSVLAALDLDGDGKMEVIVDSAYYEGEATTVYRCTPEKIEELVSTGCGA
jgi:hypothetical protein